MKFAHKIRKLVQPLTYRRAWRRLQRFFFPLPLAPLRAKIDKERLREIQQRYVSSTDQYAKYADVDRWLRVNRERVQDLKLHRSRPVKVLDLGCGGGFFLFILKRFHHSVLGLDIDESPRSDLTPASESLSIPQGNLPRFHRASDARVCTD